MKHINPKEKMSINHFCELFEQLPLNDKERQRINTVYWNLYTTFLTTPEIDPLEAWVVTKNVFISQETQIKDRMVNI